MKKRSISLLLALLLILSVFPAGAFAEQTTVESFVKVNPLYAGIVSESDIPLPSSGGEKASYPEIPKADYQTTLEAAGADMRKAMVAREGEFYVYYCSGKEISTKDFFNKMADEAMKHTGKSFEGDYLRWTYGGLGGNTYITRDTRAGMYYYVFDVTALYYTTAAQEKKVSDRIDELFEEFDLPDDASEYTIIRTVYDYICSHVRYDYIHRDSYDLMYTAYAALIDGVAVCQGYASLLYAMLLHEGVDARVVTSIDHGWNIARIGDLYYNLDSTWDAGIDPEHYDCFLRCPEGFPDHPREDEYKTAEFNAAYPMSPLDYTGHNWDSGVVKTKPGCTKPGVMLYTCTDPDCHDTMTAPIPATGHSYGQWTQTKAPSCTATGEETRYCENCDATQTQSVAKLPHNYVNGECTVCHAKENTSFLSSFLSFFQGLFSWLRSLFVFSLTAPAVNVHP